jgi:hypothetical protein
MRELEQKCWLKIKMTRFLKKAEKDRKSRIDRKKRAEKASKSRIFLLKAVKTSKNRISLLKAEEVAALTIM